MNPIHPLTLLHDAACPICRFDAARRRRARFPDLAQLAMRINALTAPGDQPGRCDAIRDAYSSRDLGGQRDPAFARNRRRLLRRHGRAHLAPNSAAGCDATVSHIDH